MDTRHDPPGYWRSGRGMHSRQRGTRPSIHPIPQGYFLLGTVAEVGGDTGAAIDVFEKTFQLAADSNTQLAAIARIRMGTLLQRSANISFLGEDQPHAAERGDSGSCGYEGLDIQGG